MFQEPENLFSPLLILNAKGKYESVLLLSFYYLGDGCTMNSVSWSVLRTYLGGPYTRYLFGGFYTRYLLIILLHTTHHTPQNTPIRHTQPFLNEEYYIL